MRITSAEPAFKGGIYFNTNKIPLELKAQEQLSDILDFSKTADIKIIDQKGNIAMFFTENMRQSETKTANLLKELKGIRLKHYPNIKKEETFLAKVLQTFENLQIKRPRA